MKITPHANDIVAVISHLFLNNKDHADKVFAVTVRVDVNDYLSEKTLPSVGGYISIAVVPSGYRKVYAAFSERRSDFTNLDWSLVCSHDSAWRDDGVIATLKHGYDVILTAAEKKFHEDVTNLSVYIVIEKMAIEETAKIFGKNRVSDIQAVASFSLN